jgi:hypothetical protein
MELGYLIKKPTEQVNMSTQWTGSFSAFLLVRNMLSGHQVSSHQYRVKPEKYTKLGFA